MLLTGFCGKVKFETRKICDVHPYTVPRYCRNLMTIGPLDLWGLVRVREIHSAYLWKARAFTALTFPLAPNLQHLRNWPSGSVVVGKLVDKSISQLLGCWCVHVWFFLAYSCLLRVFTLGLVDYSSSKFIKTIGSSPAIQPCLTINFFYIWNPRLAARSYAWTHLQMPGVATPGPLASQWPTSASSGQLLSPPLPGPKKDARKIDMMVECWFNGI